MTAYEMETQTYGELGTLFWIRTSGTGELAPVVRMTPVGETPVYGARSEATCPRLTKITREELIGKS